jgi:hypothetical protein
VKSVNHEAKEIKTISRENQKAKGQVQHNHQKNGVAPMQKPVKATNTVTALPLSNGVTLCAVGQGQIWSAL